jgi:uncharacterized protein (DUF433 family)
MELLTVQEAAVAAGVDIRAVNDAIDRQIIPAGLFKTEGGRRLTPEGCVIVSFYSGTGDMLTADLRAKIISDMTAAFLANTLGHGALTAERWSNRIARLAQSDLHVKNASEAVRVDMTWFAQKVLSATTELEEAMAMVSEDGDIMGGVPCIRNTRIPVYDVAASVNPNIAMSDILDAYPDLTERDVRLAEIYVRAHPARGRPRSVAEGYPDAKQSFQRSVPRNQ